MLFRICIGRTAGLLLSAALVGSLATGLVGCSVLSSDKSCEGSDSRLKQLATLKILESRPAHASSPKDYGGVTTECDDDSSGDAWLHADLLYSYPGSKTEVLDYYRKAAAANGWKAEQNTTVEGVPPEVQGICFTKGADGEAMLLQIDFRTQAFTPAPDFGTATGYEITAGAEVDGSPIRCWE